MQQAPVFLIVEPSEVIRLRMGQWLRAVLPGYQIVFAQDSRQAERIIDMESITIGLVEMRMPDGAGLNVVRSIRERWSDTQVIVTTFLDQGSFRKEALDAGADIFLPKHRLYTELIPLITKNGRGSDDKAKGIEL